MKRFSIIGAGRLGTALGDALTQKGWDLAVIADRDLGAARESRRIIGRGAATADILRAARGEGVLFICVPDDAVEAVARKLARSGTGRPGRLVFHTSGRLPAAALNPLRRRGARTASLHPVQSFPVKEKGPGRFRGISWGLEGDPEAVTAGEKIVALLGGKPLILKAEDKPLYHAACSLAANGFVALEAMAADLLAAAGVERKSAPAVLLPLVQGTLHGVKELGLEKALTGPVVRGDVRTVEKHLRALRPLPLEDKIYRSLGLRALGLLAGRKITGKKIRALRRLLEDKRLPLRGERRTSRRRVP